jgi:hypothetical protein
VIAAGSILSFYFVYLALLPAGFLMLIWVSATSARISSAVAVQVKGVASVFRW